MPRYEAIRDRLHSLYRPDDADGSLFSLLLRAVGQELEVVDQAASDLLQSHWFRYADAALFNAYYLRSRQLAGRPSPDPTDAQDREEMEAFPFIHDLAYLAALLPLAPWQEPPALREPLEAYRLRIRRMVELYTGGLGTLQALRRVVEASLPVDLSAPEEIQDLPFLLEEFAPLDRHVAKATTRGAPDGIVGPLMHWALTNGGLYAAAPTVYIQGVAPEPPVIGATTNPVVELYAAGDSLLRVGIAYEGTLAAGETLRLRPAHMSWLAAPAGLLSAESRPAEDAPADPAPLGPWQPTPDSPAGAVALLQTQDHALWVAVTTGDKGELHRYDGGQWTTVQLDAAPELGCLAEHGQQLWIGTAKGLRHMPLYPKQEGHYQVSVVTSLDGPAVRALVKDRAGQWWAGTSHGLLQGPSPEALAPFGLGADDESSTNVYAIHEDRSGALHCGTALGLFQFQPSLGHWYWYEGKEAAEQAGDWRAFYPERSGGDRHFPTAEQVYLPPVRCVHQGPDTSVWLGTERGIARYVAHAVRGLTYQTVLEAFPDLGTEAVYSIREDEHGVIWFCTGRGLFRFDGRDWWQLQENEWQRLGRADTLYDKRVRPRGAWRYERASGKWQQLDYETSRWVDFSGTPRSSAEAAIQAVCWTDAVVADVGTWDGETFSSATETAPGKLRMRFKPDELRIQEGGLPALPRLPVGKSAWRYLMLEEGQDLPDDRPFWTREGRRLGLVEGHPAALEGRLEAKALPFEGRPGFPGKPSGRVEQVFSYAAAAHVWFAYAPRQRLSVLVHLRAAPGQTVEAAVLDRVWEGMQLVRPAGVRTALAVNDKIVRGGNNG